MLANFDARSRNIPGTHQVRNTMRHQTHANRICYGTPLFVTFSPSERDTTLMLRLARGRQADPALGADPSKPFPTRDKPGLDVEFFELDPEALKLRLPEYDERRAMLAKDSVACADGFRVLVQLAMRHLFGVRCCFKCPDCASSEAPCMDAFGSNAAPCGGVFGRMDAVYGSIECQKSGALHVHFQARSREAHAYRGSMYVICTGSAWQLFVQYHQFTPLFEMQKLGAERRRELLRKYCAYNAHVTRTVYEDPEAWKRDREETEAQWPEYRNSTHVLSRPRYQADDGATPAADWRKQFLHSDVEHLQQLKQNHVHNMPKTPGGPRLPLTHCRDPKDPTKCKAGFPRDKRLAEQTLLVCNGLAQKMDMPVKGKRSMLGMLWGPCNDPNLNGNHPAMLAGLRCNGDVQVPYRFPITEELHDDARCEHRCGADQDVMEVTRQAQINQSAQSGYSCDYQNKRLPIAVNEVNEWKKSHQELAAELQDNKSGGYVGAREAKRLITDCYARGVCRGSVECANLIDHTSNQDPTNAEAIKTAPVTEVALNFGIQLLKAAVAGEPLPAEREQVQNDRRCYGSNKHVHCPQLWTLYGERGADPRVRALSAFEFVRYYHCQLANHPTLAHSSGCAEQHAALTDSGKRKLADQVSVKYLRPGIDHQIKEGGGRDWMPLGTGTLAKPHRHDWILAPRKRPNVPVVHGALGSRSDDEHAMKMLLLFCPWTTNPADATEDVPYIGELRKPDAPSWTEALRARWTRAHGFQTAELKRYVLNYAFVYCLPRQLQPEEELAANSDNENLKDAPCHLEEQELQRAKATRIRGEEANENQAEGQDQEDPAPPDAGQPGDQKVLTRKMFNLSHNIWIAEHDEEQAQAEARIAGEQRRKAEACRGVEDARRLRDAARASKTKNRRDADNRARRRLAGLHGAVKPPEVSSQGQITAALLRSWLHGDDVRPHLNAEQHAFLSLIVDRVLVEYDLLDPEETALRSRKPLVWLLHGPPGTGKSHVLAFVRKLFEKLLHYLQGIDFEIGAFQATNATDIRGNTLHSACGISARKHALDGPTTPEAARRMAFWRWLIIDEIGMVSARLLAQVDLRIRTTKPRVDPWKHAPDGQARPFGGVNVLFCGDFMQLPPPEGGFLADLPRSWRQPLRADARQQDPLAAHGQDLFWNRPRRGIEGRGPEA